MEPEREELRNAINDIVEGRRTREDVASWAERKMLDLEYERKDLAAWEVLKAIAGADLEVEPGSYLHCTQDIQSWLEELD
ncbi:hypothetical protein ABZ897_33840 [Nonomuraea sp. NPDC046802]|uniref:hypothetical protein n=1 Tax=Nonomuraea sp. NPDC046802 TaxID=3154919 RepID=UPI0033D67201